jgi:hypothetical protein
MLASYQCNQFPIILRAMQSAEEEVQMYTSIARNAIGGQAFHSDATAYPSQAETTVNRYSTEHAKGTDGYNSDATNKSSTFLEKNDSCFGCSSPHPWMRNKVVLCPHKNYAEIHETAAKKHKEWLAKCKARHKKCKGIDYDCLSDGEDQKASPKQYG